MTNSDKQTSQNTEESRKKRQSTKAFPKNTLEDSLRIAQSIKENNAGRPFSRFTLAKSLNYSPNSSGFRLLIISAGKFGLTTGGYLAEKIELTPLGLSIVSPRTEIEKKEALKKALFNIPFYEKFYNDFKNNKLPNEELLKNTLNRDYGIPLEDTGLCIGLLKKNAEFLGIIEDYKGAKYIHLNKLEDMEEDRTIENGDENSIDRIEPDLTDKEDGQKPTEIKQAVLQNVFISHGHNKDIVNQLKELLTFGKFTPVIAAEHNTTAIPVPEKVLNEMKACFAGIIHVEDEQKMMDSEGKEHLVLNQNVLIEIGSALALYGKNIILLVKKGTQLPSNLQGLYKCEYEGEKLDYDATMRLLKTFNELAQE